MKYSHTLQRQVEVIGDADPRVQSNCQLLTTKIKRYIQGAQRPDDVRVEERTLKNLFDANPRTVSSVINAESQLRHHVRLPHARTDRSTDYGAAAQRQPTLQYNSQLRKNFHCLQNSLN